MEKSKQLSQAIRRLRLAEGMSQEEIAFKLGLSQGYYSKLEQDPYNIRLASLEKIGFILGKELEVSFLDPK